MNVLFMKNIITIHMIIIFGAASSINSTTCGRRHVTSRRILLQNEQGYVPLHMVAEFPRAKKLTTDYALVAEVGSDRYVHPLLLVVQRQRVSLSHDIVAVH